MTATTTSVVPRFAASAGLFDEADFEERPSAAGFVQTKATDIEVGDEVLLVPGKGAVTVGAVHHQGPREGFYRPKVYLAPGLGWWSREARLFVRKAAN